MSRGNGRMRIFLDDLDYRKFWNILAEVLDLYNVDCWDACMMPNHFHLALLNNLPNLPEAMQHLNGEYAIWWNARHGKVGHTFQGRYKDQIVQHESYLKNLLRYIALNPVRAGLVKSPELWQWSAYRWTAGLAPNPGFVCSDIVLSQFGEATEQVRRQRYIRHVLATMTDDDERFHGFRSRKRILGDRQFKHTVLRQLARSNEMETMVATAVAVSSG